MVLSYHDATGSVKMETIKTDLFPARRSTTFSVFDEQMARADATAYVSGQCTTQALTSDGAMEKFGTR